MHDSSTHVATKIKFYLMSLWGLFFLIGIISIKDPSNENWDFVVSSQELWLSFILPVFMFVLALLCLGLAKYQQWEWQGSSSLPWGILNIKNQSYEHLTFLTTYIIPLISFDFEKINYWLALLCLLVLIGWIYIKDDLYFGNPTLAVLGYRLYVAQIKGKDGEITLISKSRLSITDKVRLIKVDNNVFLAKKA